MSTGIASFRGDAELVAAAQASDTNALEELLRRHQDRIYALCRRVAGDADAALDATQDALIAITRGIGRFDGRSSFSTWVYRVASNAALDEVRRHKRRPLFVADPGGDDASPRTGGAGGGWTGTHGDDDFGTRVSDRIDLDRALMRLPDDQRTAIVLRDLLDFDYAAVAEILDVPVGTVKSRIARGRVALASALGVPSRSERGSRPPSGNLPEEAERQKERGVERWQA